MKFKLKDLLKRACATTLAVACFMTSACFMPIENYLQVKAAEAELDFYFIHNISGEKIEQTANVLEGVRLNIFDNLLAASSTVSGSYNYNAETPFELVKTTTTPENPTAPQAAQHIALGDSNEGVIAYAQPLLGLTGNYPDANKIAYNLIPQVQYGIYETQVHNLNFNFQGTAYSSTNKDDLVPKELGMSFSPVTSIISNNAGVLQINDVSNKLVIKYTGDTIKNMVRTKDVETDDDGVSYESPTVETWEQWTFGTGGDPVWEIETSSGYFENYKLTEVSFPVSSGSDESKITRNGEFKLSNGTPTQDIKVSVEFGSLGSVATIYSGAYFEFDFAYKTTDFNLSLQVKTRADALFDIASDISTNPTSYPTNSIPATNKNSSNSYIKYNDNPYIFANDPTKVTEIVELDRQNISSGFFLKTRHAEYNYANGFYITWEWEPEGLKYVPDLTVYKDPGDEPELSNFGTQAEYDDAKAQWDIDKANYDQYIKNKKDYEENYEEYDERIEFNDKLINAVQIPDFQIIPSTYDDDGNVTSHKWSTTGTTYASNGYMPVVVVPGEDNITGSLSATVHVFGDKNNYGVPIEGDTSDVRLGDTFYDGRGDVLAISSTRETKVDITVTGRGVSPRFYITDATVATYDPDTYSYDQYGKSFSYEAGLQTRFPIFKYFDVPGSEVGYVDEVKLGEYTTGVYNMDVNNGAKELNQPPASIPAGYVAPVPIAPWKVEGAIEFGSGILQCDRLVVTNVSDVTSEANIYMEYRVNEFDPTPIAYHNFATDGNTWEIPIDYNDFNAVTTDYVYFFGIEAMQEGLMELDFHFYSGNSTESKIKYEGVGIQIGSSLPSSDALLDKVYLHLVQNETDDKAEDERIAGILADLFSDKSTTTASENPYSGKNQDYNNEFLPTDIIYNTDFEYVENGNYFYYETEVPYVISDVRLTPIYDSVAQANNALFMTVSDPSVSTTVTGDGYKHGDYSGASDEMSVISSNNSNTYDTPAKWILIQTLAANSSTSEKYYLKLVQAEAASEVVLNNMYVETTDLLGENITLDLNNATGTVVQFESDPVGVGMRYYITLPYYYYAQQIPVSITAESNGSWSKSPTVTSDDGLVPRTSFLSGLLQTFSNKTTETFVLNYDDLFGLGSNAIGSTYPNKFTITTFSESSSATAEYYLTILIQAPDKNDDLSNLQVLDPTSDDTVIPFKNGSFVKTKDDYIVEIPYELQKYRFSALPDSNNAMAVRLTAPDGTIIGTTTYATPGTPIQFLVDFEELGLTSNDLNFTFTIAVQSEDGIWSDQFNHPEGHLPYTILFQRSAPNTDSLLQSLDVLNFETATPLPEYVFEQVKKDYIFTVPYTTERIIIKPTAVEQERTTITLNGVDFPDEDPGKDYYLKAGESNTFTIVVTAEDPAYTTTYNLYITRSNPDTEARLLNLVVNGAESMVPALFVPSTFTYDVVIPAGTSSYTITPTAVSEYSVILIDGIVIPSGTATQPYNAVDEKTTIKVYVSAQDGVTTQTYTLNITNKSLIETSDEALLLDVKIQGVDIEPAFKSNIDDYEVYTKIDTTTLDITPTVSKGATVSVSVGSKKLDNLNGIYSTSFFTETDTISIVVTSESGKVSKTYKFAVYKNTPDKEGIFQPITSDDVDWNGENPIVVDITKYSVVDASVFNTLKDNHPDKTLVFNGNDYMFRVTGSDITRNIPHTTQYDFGMSFTSPEEPLVQAILDDSEYEEDNELEPIYVYFNDHGALPAQMVLTVILGSEVGDQQLYWNYYNTEFDRIDYYGYVQANSKGTITVPIAHFSTYLVSTHQIYASEDRTNTGFGSLELGNHTSGQSDGSIGSEGPGDDLTGGFGSGSGSTGGGNISGDLSSTKPNPQTEADPTTNTARVNYEQTTVYKWYDERKKQLQDEEKQEC